MLNHLLNIEFLVVLLTLAVGFVQRGLLFFILYINDIVISDSFVCALLCIYRALGIIILFQFDISKCCDGRVTEVSE